MAQPSILAGIYVDNGPDVRVALPVNMVPVAVDNGVSAGFMRPAEGIVLAMTGAGTCRGLYNWNGTLFAVFGTVFGSIDANHNFTTLGTVADGGPVTMVNSFERLAIAAGNRLYYWNLSTLTEVTDARLGVVLDVEWVGGYFVTTDGEFLVTTSLSDPTVIRAFDYSNPESSPDPVVAVLRTRNEINALGRVTIEVFANVGGTGFPLATIQGAQVMVGVVGTHACCEFLDAIALLGSGNNQQPAIFLAAGGSARKISTYEIDLLLASYTELELSEVILEARNDSSHQNLYVHLPDRTMVFDAAVTEAFGRPVWFTLSSSLSATPSQYRARFFTWCYDRWYCGDPTSHALGYMDSTIGSHYGDDVRCEVSTQILYNESRGGIVQQLELVCLPGHVPAGVEPVISTSHSNDGQTWLQDKTISAGMTGDRQKRLQWRRQGKFSNLRMQRFTFNSSAHLSILRLEATITPLVR